MESSLESTNTLSSTTPNSVLSFDPSTLSHSFYLSTQGLTNIDLPLDDSPNTPYLSYMEVPVEDVVMESLDRHVTLNSKETEEIPQEPIREVVLTNFNWFWSVVEQELTKRQFQILQLYYMYGYSQQKIADMLQLRGGQAVVAQILQVSYARLRRRLGNLLAPLLRLP